MTGDRRLVSPLRARGAGVLLHPTSLPGPGPVGTLGRKATEPVLSWLERAGQSVWQTLPVTVVGDLGSPYDGGSATAGEPGLIDLDEVAIELGVEPGFDPLRKEDRGGHPTRRARARVLAALPPFWEAFRRRGHPELERAWDETAPGADPSLGDGWALFDALRAHFGGRPWWRWEPALRSADPAALAEARRALAEEVERRRFAQAIFHWQWGTLRRRANERGVEIHGDLPFYVSRDSADVWLRRSLFAVAPDGAILAQGGVPPDYFSETGQAWGVPVFQWSRHRDEGFAWWIERLRVALARCDRVRIDHFRGLVAYWRIPGDAPDAREGAWVGGPGRELFEALHRQLGPLPLVAENLGVITPEVENLRRSIGAPGIKVLQFAFDESDSGHLPRHHGRDDVAYTGTHDNPPTATWYRRLPPDARRRFRDLAGSRGRAHRRLAALALGSVADLAVLPAQDVLGLGGTSRMNTPGTASGNWAWRLDGWEGLERAAEWLREETEKAGRATS